MHGGVGRGKSFLMDCFFQSVPLTRKTRLHFHEFMREVHRELQDLKGTADPLDELGRRIARRYRLICFDEFHVADVTDAMILHRLLEAMFANRVSIVTTSNFHPDDLYPNGLHRDRILPAIELLKDKLEVVSVDGPTDYRRAHAAAGAACTTPAGPAGRRGDAATPSSVSPKRATRTPCCTSSSARCARCAAPAAWSGSTSRRCAAARVRRTTTSSWRSSSTPCCCRACRRCRRAWPARRAASRWLVDVLYDRRVKLIVSAARAARGAVRQTGRSRTSSRAPCRACPRCSRPSYLALQRRDVETALT